MKKKAYRVIRGAYIRFKEDPWEVGAEKALDYCSDGMIAIDEGKIVAYGPAEKIKKTDWIASDTRIEHFSNSIIVPGFIDSHTHYPQIDVAAAYGEKLLDWLNNYTFPAEERMNNANYASKIARFFLAECIKNGITSIVAFSSSSFVSADVLFQEAAKINMRLINGVVFMDYKVPEGIRKDTLVSYENAKKLIEKWHQKGKAEYAIIDRFALTSSEIELKTIGRLWQEHPDCYFHTHLAENKQECEQVMKLHQGKRSYLEVYDYYGLVREKSIFAHCIHLDETDLTRLSKAGSLIAHSPSSNLFLGSGLFNLKKNIDKGIKVNLATDFAAGNKLSMLGVMDSAYKAAQLCDFSLHPAYAFYMATTGAAKNLGWEKKTGNIDVGLDADLVVLDNDATALMSWRTSSCKNIKDLLFVHMAMGDERAIKAVFMGGRRVFINKSLQLI